MYQQDFVEMIEHCVTVAYDDLSIVKMTSMFSIQIRILIIRRMD